MFCPNCGNNCENANFCPKCGTKLPQSVEKETESAVWKIGMPCPHCGGTKLDGDCCAFCGAQLTDGSSEVRTKETVKDESCEIPCGFYKGVNSSLTLYERECVVSTTPLFKKYVTTIPYDKITRVFYQRPKLVSFDSGHLLFRWEGNKNEPVRENHNYAADKTTVGTNTYPDWIFYHIYYMLKAIAPPTAQFSMKIIPVKMEGLDELAKKTDIDAYYDKYAPFRQDAVDEMCRKTGAEKLLATELINRVFDARQKELYDKDPRAAVLDLNLIMGRKRLEDEKVKQALAARKEQLRRERALYNIEQAIREKR